MEQIVEYHRRFNVVTGNGNNVLNGDYSSIRKVQGMPLTPEEQTARQNWSTMRRSLKRFYSTRDSRYGYEEFVNSTDRLLEQQVPPPDLKTSSVSSASHASEPRKRKYPPSIESWDTFDVEVNNFRPVNRQIVEPESDSPLLHGLQLTSKQSRESGELDYVQEVVLEPLASAGLLRYIDTKPFGSIGTPDLTLCTGAGETMLVPVEFKTTHNLLLPLDSCTLVQKYNSAYEKMMIENVKSIQWVNICHPVGQIVTYMVDNTKRYGVLSSGTRTYFLQLVGTGQQLNLKISRGWLVGTRNYLRAWACLYHRGEVTNNDTFEKPDWITPPSSPDKHSKPRGSPGLKKGGSSSRSNDRSSNASGNLTSSSTTGLPSHTLALFSHEPPFVPFSAFVISHVIGQGKNGSVFAVHWNKQNVALKQFDVSKGGYESYIKELEAYKHLQGAWGDLVVTPLFVSESWSGNVVFLGLQLGRSSSQKDLSFQSEKEEVLHRLFDEYGFDHTDPDDCNFVYIPGGSGDAQGKLVAIDLEYYRMYSKDKS